MNLGDFRTVLECLQSSSPETLAEAEQVYSSLLQTNGIQVVQNHLDNISQSAGGTSQLFSIILLGQIFSRFANEIFGTQPLIEDSQIQQQLLNFLQNPSLEQNARLNLTNTIFKAAKFYYPNERWNSFPNDLLFCCQNESESVSVASIDCLSSCLQCKLFPVNDSIEILFTEEKTSFYKLMAVLRLGYISCELGYICQPLRYSLLNFFYEQISDEILNTVLSDLAAYRPTNIDFFGDTIGPIFELIIQIFIDVNKNRGTRELALELLLEFSEENPNELVNQITILIQAIVKVMTELDDSYDINADDYEDPTPRTSAENALQQISEKCSESIPDFADICLEYVRQFSQSSAFQERRASYMILNATVHDISSSLFGCSEELIQLIRNGFNDPVSYVRDAAFGLVATASLHLGPTFQYEFHHVLVNDMLSSEPTKPVLIALASFFKYSNRYTEIIHTHVNQVLTYIVDAFNIPDLTYSHRVLVMNCLKSIALCLRQEYFSIVYSILFPIIESNSSLSIDAIEIFSMIGMNEPTSEYINTVGQILEKIATIDRTLLNQNELNSLNEAIKYFVVTVGTIYNDTFLLIEQRILESGLEELTYKEYPMSLDRTDFVNEVLIQNKEENKLILYNLNELNDMKEELITLSFLLGAIPESIQLIEDIMRFINKALSIWFYPKVQSSAVDCLGYVIMLLDSNNVTEYSNVFTSTFSAYLEIPIENLEFYSACEFIGFCIELAIKIIQYQCDYTDIFPLFIKVVQYSLERIQIEKDKDIIDFHVDIAKLIGYLIQMSPESDVLQEPISSSFQLDSDSILPGALVVWSNYARFHIPSPNLTQKIFPLLLDTINRYERIERKTAFSCIIIIEDSNEYTKENALLTVDVITKVLAEESSQDGDQKKISDVGVYTIATLMNKIPEIKTNSFIIHTWLHSLPRKDANPASDLIINDLFASMINDNNPLLLADENIVQVCRIIAAIFILKNYSEESNPIMQSFIVNIYQTNPDKFVDILSHLTEKRQEMLNSIISTNCFE